MAVSDQRCWVTDYHHLMPIVHFVLLVEQGQVSELMQMYNGKLAAGRCKLLFHNLLSAEGFAGSPLEFTTTNAMLHMWLLIKVYPQPALSTMHASCCHASCTAISIKQQVCNRLLDATQSCL